ncbi:MAG: DUF4339 domain-containing protein [Chthoniobacterales bacterium]|nr:DUF4339 domain-containing protein [Chthoniobacterales bacterium]
MNPNENISREGPAVPIQPPRPQESLLRRGDQSASKRKAGEPEIYLSWGGTVYGPAAPDDVRAGVRASYYDESTTFWHEGMDEWRPLGEFPENFAAKTSSRPGPRPGPGPKAESSAHREKKRGRSKPAKPPKPRAAVNYGLWIVLLFCLLAIGATVGIILLLMLV